MFSPRRKDLESEASRSPDQFNADPAALGKAGSGVPAVRIYLEWLFAIIAIVLIVVSTIGAYVFYVGLCFYRVAFRVRLQPLSESSDRRTNENAP